MARRRDRRAPDPYARRAKREGHRARSVYKLEEIDRRARLLRRGGRVLDLGAFPGSWTLYASERVGAQGKVLSVDRTEWRGGLPPRVEFLCADLQELTPEDLGGKGAFDVVLCDAAPSTTGHRFTDQARSFDLFMSALELAIAVLAPGGSFVGKIFQGPDFEQAQRRVREAFRQAKVFRPSATRSESYEVFLAGLSLRGDS